MRDRTSVDVTTATLDRARLLPSGLSPSAPDDHGQDPWLTRSTGHWLWPGRGLSPPARNCTDPGAREHKLVHRGVY